MSLLTIELGNACGFAAGGRFHIISGSDPYASFERYIRALHEAAPFTGIYCVDGGVKQRAKMKRITELAKEWGAGLAFVKRSAIGRSFVGKGNASAADLVEECKRRGFNCRTEQEAGAIALFDLALQEH